MAEYILPHRLGATGFHHGIKQILVPLLVTCISLLPILHPQRNLHSAVHRLSAELLPGPRIRPFEDVEPQRLIVEVIRNTTGALVILSNDGNVKKKMRYR
ncbi:uncharacterized protein BDZ99DRAFT_16218 [Mytilinidion resinicola]|uniref:Uncharacterized protein n=1 Tax=Mytilinidion resinicola TaxID=574789 RepID=A0A6A6Z9H8_9PEZI|nr:uncharacterized protein BDZ99DRAFT_16218 [Mytilinidion resinicola]KAF2817458.1 hypothetical protein BDZ99DRAFT_16218 [Mytilinidion resinicola]